MSHEDGKISASIEASKQLGRNLAALLLTIEEIERAPYVTRLLIATLAQAKPTLRLAIKINRGAQDELAKKDGLRFVTAEHVAQLQAQLAGHGVKTGRVLALEEDVQVLEEGYMELVRAVRALLSELDCQSLSADEPQLSLANWDRVTRLRELVKEAPEGAAVSKAVPS
jgi:hypothetical protein